MTDQDQNTRQCRVFITRADGTTEDLGTHTQTFIPDPDDPETGTWSMPLDPVTLYNGDSLHISYDSGGTALIHDSPDPWTPNPNYLYAVLSDDRPDQRSLRDYGPVVSGDPGDLVPGELAWWPPLARIEMAPRPRLPLATGAGVGGDAMTLCKCGHVEEDHYYPENCCAWDKCGCKEFRTPEPASDPLTYLRALVEQEPIGVDSICGYCDRGVYPSLEPGPDNSHAPDCPWLRARDYLKTQP